MGRFLSQMSEGAGLNGDRNAGIHLLGSQLPRGFGGLSPAPYAEDQVLAFHEYFHVVQHSHIFTRDRNERNELLGSVWFNEGGAEFMAQTVTQRLRESGDLTASTWDSLAERMTWKMRDVTDWMTSNTGQKSEKFHTAQIRTLPTAMGPGLMLGYPMSMERTPCCSTRFTRH